MNDSAIWFRAAAIHRWIFSPLHTVARCLSRRLLPLVLLIVQAHGQSVAIQDASFDNRVLSVGTWNYTLTPWQETGGTGNGNGYLEYISGFAADGTNHLGMMPSHNVWQDLGVTYQAGTRYTLTVAVGNRSGHTTATNESRYLLADSSGTVYATGSYNASVVAAGTFADAPTLVFETGSAPAAIGKTLRILLQAGSSGRSHFDRIRLTAVAMSPPTATSGAASNVTDTTATLAGTVNAKGLSTAVSFAYGTTTAYGSTATATPTPVTGSTNTAVSAALTGLAPGTAYHYRVAATSSAGTTFGADRVFTTGEPVFLSGLAASPGTLEPAFSRTVLSYSLQVPYSVSSVAITPVEETAGSTIRVQGAVVASGTASSPLSLALGNTTVTVGVSAPGGLFAREYVVTVTRLPQIYRFTTAATVPVTAERLDVSGLEAALELGFAPATGTQLTVVKNTGAAFIKGEFSNLTQGQRVDLSYQGVTYPLVANYYGGTGNDLVLQWAYTRYYAWGGSSYALYGDGSLTSSTTPVAITPGGALADKTIVSLACGSKHRLGLCSDGTLAFWGYNYNLGVAKLIPQTVDSTGALAGKKAIAIAAGKDHSLVLCSDGTVVSWGSNISGQLGTGGSSTTVPTAVSGGGLAGKQVVAIAAGIDHSLALCSDGTLAAWGSNTAGELGNGTTSGSTLPVAVVQTGVLAGRSIVGIAAGGSHSMALCSDGRIANWGGGTSGGLGNGATSNSSVPVAVDTSGVLAGKTVTAIASGYNCNLALCSDGTIVAWGYNGFGGLGNGTNTNSSVPVAVTSTGVLSGKVATAISANYASFALCSDGTLAAWGDNQRYQLGDGTSSGRNTPILTSLANLAAGDKLTGLGSGCASECVMASAAVPLSNNNNLASLALGQATLDPVFSPGTLAYTAGVLHGTASLRVTPVAADARATATVNGVALAAGETGAEIPAVPGAVIQIRVTAENGTLKTYALTVREDALLADLRLGKGSLLPEFSPFVRAYSVALATADAALRITPVTADPAAVARVNGALSGTDGVEVPLVYGENPVTVLVTAGDGTELIYQLTVTRPGGLNYTYASASGIPVTATQYVADGNTISLALGYAPATGTTLMVVRNTGDDPLVGRFSNLDHGQTIRLGYNGISYPFVANYYGGTGNDLVLQWANTAAYGWGENQDGQVGNGKLYDCYSAEAVMTSPVLLDKTILSLATGGNHTLALCADGTLAAWGANGKGQLGNGNTTGGSMPEDITASGILAGRRVVAIAAGESHSMALCADGTLAAWGDNSGGQLGNGGMAPCPLPVAVKRSGILAGKTIMAMSAGRTHSLAFCSDGTVAAWGANSSGQLGIGSTVASLVPVRVVFDGALASKRVAEVGAGGSFSVARFTDGSLASWGTSSLYQLGNGTTTSRQVPTPIPQTGAFSGKSVSRISVGSEHSLALCSDGTMVGWGRSESGRLGNGSYVTVPALVSTTGALSGKTVTDFAAGYSHSLAVCSDGTLAFWGWITGGAGEISTPTAVSPAMPAGNKVSALAKGGMGGHAMILACVPTGTNSALASLAVEGGMLDAVFSPSVTAYGVWLPSGTTTIRVAPVTADPNATVTVNGQAVARGAASEPIAVVPGGSIVIRATAQNGAAATNYTLTVENNASLAGLSTGSGVLEPAFSPAIKTYQAVVTSATAEVALTATAGAPEATLTVNGEAAVSGQPSDPVVLVPGPNALAVVVTGAGGSSETYTVTVIRQVPLSHTFSSAVGVARTSAAYTAAGNTAQFSLGFAPPVGTALRVINNTGNDFIDGEFDNLAHGQRVELVFNGITYPFVANYFGGSGNDLVLQWANVRVAGWGSNNNNQLGLGVSSGSVLLPTPMVATGVLAGKTVIALAAGWYHSLALCSDGTVAAWGHSSNGQLGTGSPYDDAPTPVAVTFGGDLAGKRVVAIAAGETFSMALCSDGTVAYWGRIQFNYSNGTLGYFVGYTPTVLPETGRLAGRKPVGIAVGRGCFFVRCSDGTVVGWGNNDTRALGNNSTTDGIAVSPDERGVLAGKMVTLLAAANHCLAATDSGGLVTWGANASGQLGDGSTTTSPVPVAVNMAGVLAGKTPAQVAAGSNYSLVNCTDGTLAAWGSNSYGELGRGTTGSSNVPVLVLRTGVLSGKTVSGIAAGGTHGLGVCSDGTLATWGNNSSGQVGDNSTSNRYAPVLVNTSGLAVGERFVSACGGDSHSLAITALPVAPIATTLAASGVLDTGATLNGSVSGQGSATSVSFEYGPTTDYGFTIAAIPATVTGSTATAVKATLSGLTSGASYHFRVLASGAGGVVRGVDRTFDTSTLANLTGLALDEAEVMPGPDPSRSNYVATVPYAIAETRVTPTCADGAATVTVNGTAVISGEASGPVSLAVGNTAIPVVVSGTGGNSRTYTLTVTRLPETLVFDTSARVPVTAAGFVAAGDAPGILLGHAPQPGATLTLVNNSGAEPIMGSFANLGQGRVVNLDFGGMTYPFAVNYAGGTGNDLVLQWAAMRLMSWGGNSPGYNETGNRGQLGNGTNVNSPVPVAVDLSGALAGKVIVAHAAGGYHNLVLCADGTLASWGWNKYGQLGNGTNTSSNTPVELVREGEFAGRLVTAIAAGVDHSMALCADGALFIWGNNWGGQLGDNSTTTRSKPIRIDGNGALAGRRITAIWAGNSASFALCADGVLAAWGWNDSGQLGDGSTDRRYLPVKVNQTGALAGKTIKALAAGGNHVLCLCANNILVAWGSNVNGQFGNGATTTAATPDPVAVTLAGTLAGKTITGIGAGNSHSVALCTDGTLAAWGLNYSGQLGDGSTSDRTSPAAVIRTGVLSGKSVVWLGAGDNHTLARCSDGTLAAWGANGYGALGDGTTVANSTPVLAGTGAALAGERVVGLAGGAGHSLALVASVVPPAVTPLAASGITDSGATLNGSVNANGTASTVSFEYGTTPSYLTTVAAAPESLAGTGATPVSAALTGLQSETTYQYRVVATNGMVTVRSEFRTFSTTGLATLASLSVDRGALMPAFSPRRFDYDVTVPFGTTTATINAVAAAPGATVTVNGSPVMAGDPGVPVALALGGNAVRIAVASPDGSFSTDYIVNITQLPQSVRFTSAEQAGIEAGDIAPGGEPLGVELGFSPPVGGALTLVRNRGTGPIRGTFAGLEQGASVQLDYGGVIYPFVVNYYGGSGNDLVLEWGNVRLVAWGSNASSQSGNGAATSSTVPLAVRVTGALAGRTPLAAVASRNHSLVLCTDGELAAFGYNGEGQLGNGSTVTSADPGLVLRNGVLEGKRIVAIPGMNYGATHVLCDDGTVAAWGNNGYGQVGDGSTTNALSPVKVSPVGALAGKRVMQLAGCLSHTLALCSDGTVAAWGNNSHGQLGDGTLVVATTPVAVNAAGVLAGKVVTAVATGWGASYALCADGSVAAWGLNTNGELGDGTTQSRTQPVAVNRSGALAGKTVIAIQAGDYHCLALCSDGSLVAWGDNSYGQLGDGSTADRLVPVAVDRSGVLAGKTVVEISAGEVFSLALCADGSLATWGRNSSGQLGDGTTTNRSLPVLTDVSGFTGGQRLIAADAGNEHTLAVVAMPPPPMARTLAATGINDSGVLLNGLAGANGAADPVTVAFEYGASSAYGTTVAASPASVAGADPVAVGCELTGLPPGTVFHYRVVVAGTLGVTKGEDRVFSTTAEAVLAGLGTDRGGLTPAFFPPVGTYSLTVENAVETISLTPVAAHAGASITVDGEPVVSGAASPPIPLAEGANPIRITVLPQGGGAGLTYTVSVVRMPAALVVNSLAEVPLVVPGMAPSGADVSVVLGFAPVPGSSLMLIRNTGNDPIRGSFANLAHNQRIELTHAGVRYAFVADYQGGSGNDLVLRWADTRLAGWGSNQYGQLGISTSGSSYPPGWVAMPAPLAGKTIKDISSGWGHTLVLFTDGTLAAFGYNNSGQVGNGTSSQALTPVLVSGSGALAGRTVVAVAAGGSHSLALCADGTLAAWGYNLSGHLGNGSTTGSTVPTQVTQSGVLAGKTITAIATRGESSLALCSDGTLAAWGYNGSGQLGDGTQTTRNTPVLVDRSGVLAGRKVVSIACGTSHCLALCDDGALAAWGSNNSGALGDGTTTNRSLPVLVDLSGVLAGRKITAISASQHSMALCADGTLATWGNNASGQLGNNSTANASLPVGIEQNGVLAGKTVTEIACGPAGSSYAITADGGMAAWGANSVGELGDGTTTGSLVPVAVNPGLLAPGGRFIAMAGGSAFAQAVLAIAPEPANPVAASTLAASGITDSSAILNGSVNAAEIAVSVSFEYGPTDAYGWISAAAPAAVSGATDTPVSARLENLAAATPWHFRVVATGPAGVSRGADQTFTTGNAATLAALGLSAGTLEPAFAPGTFDYATAVSNETATLVATPQATHSGAVIRVNGAVHASGEPTAPLALAPGGNLIEIAVDAGDGVNTATYRIRVLRLPGEFVFDSPDDIPLATSELVAAGLPITIRLNFAPVPGTRLTLVNHTGSNPIRGGFSNLPEGGRIYLTFGGKSYDFIANYQGGDGNDLVLEWGSTRVVGWGTAANGATFGSPRPAPLPDEGALAGRTITSASAASTHGVAACLDGSVFTWGGNDSGQLGDGSSSGGAVPVEVERTGALAGKRVIAVSTGGSHDLALCSDGTLAAWGSNSSGNLGFGNPLSLSRVPVRVDQTGVLAGRKPVSIAAGGSHNAVICADGTLVAWGKGGLVGDGGSVNAPVPVLVDCSGVLAGKTPVAVAAGGSHTLALCSDGTLAAWGLNSSGQLGNGTTAAATVPVRVDLTAVPTGAKVVAISAGSSHSLALCDDGTLLAWGENGDGQLGNLGTTDQTTPVPVYRYGELDGRAVVAISAGGAHSLALCGDGTMLAWGDNYFYQLGLGDKVDYPLPTRVAGGAIGIADRPVGIAAGYYGSVAIVASSPSPVVLTMAADAIGDTGSTLRGSVGGNGSDVTVSFEYGTTTGYGSRIASTPAAVAADAASPVATVIGGLEPGATYHFRVVVDDGERIVRGDDRTFTTTTRAALADLRLSHGTLSPAFTPQEHEFTATVGSGVASIKVTAVASQTGALIRVGGSAVTSGTACSVALAVGENGIAIEVLAAGGGDSRIYHLAVTRPPSAFRFDEPSAVTLTTTDFVASGMVAEFVLGHAPVPGNRLTVVRCTGSQPITGRFSNLAQGQLVSLVHGGVSYAYVADYFGGSGNDLVLHWANTRLLSCGNNQSGMLGVGANDTARRTLPTPVLDNGILDGKIVIDAKCGYYYSVVLCSDGTVVTWGDNQAGALGRPTGTPGVPGGVNVSGVLAGRKVVMIASGSHHVLALCEDGALVGWGNNYSSQLGSAGVSTTSEPVLIPLTGALAGKRITAIAAAEAHSLALCSDGTVAAWGGSTEGQTGTGSTGYVSIPMQVDRSGVLAGRKVAAIAAGGSHSLALCSDGTLAAWGKGDLGQLGNGTPAGSTVPVAVDQTGVLAGRSPVAIGCGTFNSLALCADGRVAIWGQGTSGVLGNGTSTDSAVPVEADLSAAPAGGTPVGASVGRSAAVWCADGTLSVWGGNWDGQLGDGTQTNRLQPVAPSDVNLAPEDRFAAMTCGYQHSIFLVGGMPTPPGFTLLPAGDITAWSASLFASVNARNNLIGLTFEYGLTRSYGNSVAAFPGSVSGKADAVVNTSIAGLIPGRIYHYRLVASGPGGTTRSADGVFATAAGRAPEFTGYTVSTAWQTPATIALRKLLAKASDPDGGTVAVSAAGPASDNGGSVALLADSIRYTPPDGFSGADTFSIVLTDEDGATVAGSVTVHVGQAPDAGGAGANPPVLTVLPEGKVGIAFQGIPGRSYTVQRSIGGLDHWVTLATIIADAAGKVSFTDDNPPPGSAFYRLGLP